MNDEVTSIEICINNDGGFQISYPKSNFYRVWSTSSRSNNEEINKFFDTLSKANIIRCIPKNNDNILYIEDDKKRKFKITFINYKKVFSRLQFRKLDKKINNYWLKEYLKYIQENLHIKFKNISQKIPKKYVITSSILTAGTIITLISIPKKESHDTIYTINNQFQEENGTDKNFVNANNNPIETPGYFAVDDDNEQSNDFTQIKYDDDIEEIVIDEQDLISDKISENEEKKSTNYLDFSNLSNFTTIDQYISFASNLYGVDIETANILLQGKIGNMANYINNSSNNELKNLYELKSLGIINGDLDIIGTFIIIKNYAIDNLGITNQEPITSNKTEKEKEKDIIDIARYIYGIEDTDLLNNMIAIHRLETGNGTSDYATKLNNFGGNMNGNPSQEQINRFVRIIQPKTLDIEANPIPNIYKTAEIGEESMVRNFLNVYSKCLHDEECIGKNNIADFLSKKYCTHTPENWAIEVNNLLDEGNIQEDVESYIYLNNKIL